MSLEKIYYPALALKSLLILSLFLIICFLAFYVFQVTSVISEGYQIRSYQKKIGKLIEENKNLEINIAKIKSLEHINNKMQELGFEKINKVYYIQLLESSVVTTRNRID